VGLCALVLSLSPGVTRVAPALAAGGYDDVVVLFREWRAFQQPPLVGGVPDYGASAMAAQHRGLARFHQRLAALDPLAWPVPQQVDWRIVRAEMDGFDFDHRVLRPWATNPAFYVTVFADRSDQPAREGPHAAGAIEIWRETFPLSDERAAALETALAVVPRLLERARVNLVGDGRDLWTFGARTVREQSRDLEVLASRMGDARPMLSAQVRRAKEATDGFAAWVEERAKTKRGTSGIGVAHYDWFLKHVQLAPYTWREEVALMERELSRATSFLALEEQRNAALPPQTPIASAEDYARRFPEAVAEYLAFLEQRRLLTVRPWMAPALAARQGRFAGGPREFFSEVSHRDLLVMRTHDYHWIDLARMANEPHASPIRRDPLLYNIFVTRTEGHATGWEELMLQAGLFDARPRSRELVYILLAQRAARALGDLRMHANESTLEEAAAFAAAHTPRGWLRMDASLVRWEQHLYLQQPGYGTSYLVGKMQIERILAERRRQLGDAFTMTRFMDEFDAAGLIPASLIEWELTGRKPEHLQ
jgi:Bacterial protein of unknown function (DUF885)